MRELESFFLFSVLSHLKTRNHSVTLHVCGCSELKGGFFAILAATDILSLSLATPRQSRTFIRRFVGSALLLYYTSIKELGHKYMQMNLIWHKLTTFSGAALGLRLG